jgi:galactose mutarotase-like enzyme
MPHSDRNEWKLRLPVKQHIQLNSTNIPTGEIRPISEALVDVKKAELDDVYTGLLREADCYAHFALWSPQARLTVGFGPKFPVSVVYAPHTGNFVCIEPMATITNGLNLARNGTHDSLQSVAPGATWSEEFWIKPELV